MVLYEYSGENEIHKQTLTRKTNKQTNNCVNSEIVLFVSFLAWFQLRSYCYGLGSCTKNNNKQTKNYY